MNKVYMNAYMIEAWMNMIIDYGSDPFIVIDPSLSERDMNIPLDYLVDGYLIINISGTATGYFDIDKKNGYIIMSTRFNRIEQQMEIPVECVVLVKSRCGRVAMDTPKELIMIGEKQKSATDVPKFSPIKKGVKKGASLRLVANSDRANRLDTQKPKDRPTGKPKLTLVPK